jgi:hypothetical protein
VTVTEAIGTVRRVGIVEASGGNLRLCFPEKDRAALQPAINTLRSGKTAALTLLSKPISERATSWAYWKAAELNRVFQEQGVTGQSGRITAATIRHGASERKETKLGID